MRERLAKLRKKQTVFSIFYLLASVLTFWALQQSLPGPEPRTVPFSELANVVREGKVERADVREDEILALLKAGDDPKPGARQVMLVAKRLPRIDETPLVRELEAGACWWTGPGSRAAWRSSASTPAR